MNAKLLLKTLLLILVALLLVLIGMNNPSRIELRLPPLLKDAIRQPAALMYFAFFAVGLLTGVLVTSGSGGRKGGGGKGGQ